MRNSSVSHSTLWKLRISFFPKAEYYDHTIVYYFISQLVCVLCMVNFFFGQLFKIQKYKYLTGTNLVFLGHTVSYRSSFFPLGFMACVLRAWTINLSVKYMYSVRNLRYEPQTVRSIHFLTYSISQVTFCRLKSSQNRQEMLKTIFCFFSKRQSFLLQKFVDLTVSTLIV